MTNTATQKFFDDFADSYEKITDPMDYTLLDCTKDFYKKYNIDSGSILDVGCGTGKLKPVLGENFDYTGIDFSKNMLSQAEKRGYKTMEGFIEEIMGNIEAKSYDHVVCLSVLYFIEDVELILKKFEKIARVSLTVGFEKYTQEQLDRVFNGYDGVKRYNHSSSLIDNPTEMLKDKLFWTFTDGQKVFGDIIFKRCV
jgi:ubiquinone/menaquinone biosynthesis C-methylase UbiE